MRRAYRTCVAGLLLALLSVSGCAPGGAAGEKTGENPSPVGKDARGFDLSTDEGVQAAYRQVTGVEDYAYVQRLEGVPEIVIVNDRWPDFGDVFQGAFIAGRWYPEGEELKPALTLLGWNEADARQRVEIARLWIERSRRYGQVVREPQRVPDEPDPQAPSGIRPPIYETTGSGGVRADFWVVTGWGIGGDPLYAHRKLLFDSSAKLVE